MICLTGSKVRQVIGGKMINKINISIQKNTQGDDFVQIISDDMIAVNIVLNAKKIDVEDLR